VQGARHPTARAIPGPPQVMLKLPQREANMLHDDVAARLYKRLLRDEVTSGRWVLALLLGS